MKRKSISKYVLLKKDVPIIKNNVIRVDANVGGEKLVYEKTTYHFDVFTIFGIEIAIPLLLRIKNNGKIVFNIDKETVVFFRPYKTLWSKNKRNKEPFHLWGKKEHPLTNIWVLLEFDYKDLKKSFPVIKEQVDNHVLSKFLRNHVEKFTIIN